MKKIFAILASLALALSASIPASAADPYVSKWGNFRAQTFSGTGDDVIQLPALLKAGFAVASHSGESNFAIWSLDSKLNQDSLLVNEIGSYSGEAAFGVGWSGKKTKGFEISADGDWTITVKPFAASTKLTGTGSGDVVAKYSGGTPIWKITHQGESNFAVWEYCTNGGSKLLVNEIGNYSGKVKGLGGSCIVVISADGSWTFKK